MSLFIDKKTISSLFATIILIAVIFAIAVSSAFYYAGVVGAYSSLEVVDVKTVKIYPVDNLM